MSGPLLAVFGAGQLARMLALAAHPIGVRLRCLDPNPDSPVAPMAEVITAAWDDPAAISQLLDGADAATWEIESVPVASLSAAAERTAVAPAAATVAQIRDRADQKATYDRLGIPTAPWTAPDSLDALVADCQRFGYPAVIKARIGGYDGRGVAVVRSDADASQVWQEFGAQNCIVEQMIPFDDEASIVLARSRSGDIAAYPMVRNHHIDGILAYSEAPHPDLTPELEAAARDIGDRLATGIGYVGVMAVECFLVGDRWLVNEMAPRVHNSGHWTIDGAVTDQFEQHVRACLGWPLGDPSAIGHSAMVNLIGCDHPGTDILATPGLHLHWYGKQPRPGRKVGHATLTAASHSELHQALDQVQAAVNRINR